MRPAECDRRREPPASVPGNSTRARAPGHVHREYYLVQITNHGIWGMFAIGIWGEFLRPLMILERGRSRSPHRNGSG
jgi:hypothetical protein